MFDNKFIPAGQGRGWGSGGIGSDLSWPEALLWFAFLLLFVFLIWFLVEGRKRCKKSDKKKKPSKKSVKISF